MKLKTETDSIVGEAVHRRVTMKVLGDSARAATCVLTSQKTEYSYQ